MLTGERQVQRAQGEHGGEQHDAHDAQVDEQADPDSTEQEGPQRLPPEGAVREIERDHESDEEGNVFRVEEGVRVDARMQQEQHQGDERQQPVAEHAQHEQIAEDAADQEKQVGEEVPVPVIFQTGDALDEGERRLERRAVIAISGNALLVEGALAVPQHVVDRRIPDRALVSFILADAVVVEHERGHEQEERARAEQPPMGGQAPHRQRAPHSRNAARRDHRTLVRRSAV